MAWLAGSDQQIQVYLQALTEGELKSLLCHEVGHSVPTPGGDWVSSELPFLILRTGIPGQESLGQGNSER